MYDNYLMHHGVKGMKWGIRHDKPTSGRKVEKRKAKQIRAEKRKTNISKMRNYTGSNKSDALKSARRKDINKMSNADLQKTVNRLNLERQYRDLTKVNLTPGKRYVDSYKDYNKSISQARKAASTVAVKKAMTAAAI